MFGKEKRKYNLFSVVYMMKISLGYVFKAITVIFCNFMIQGRQSRFRRFVTINSLNQVEFVVN